MTDEQYIQESLESESSPNVTKTLGLVISSKGSANHSYLFSNVTLHQKASRPSIKGMSLMHGVKDIQRLYCVTQTEAKEVFLKLGEVK